MGCSKVVAEKPLMVSDPITKKTDPLRYRCDVFSPRRAVLSESAVEGLSPKRFVAVSEQAIPKAERKRSHHTTRSHGVAPLADSPLGLVYRLHALRLEECLLVPRVRRGRITVVEVLMDAVAKNDLGVMHDFGKGTTEIRVPLIESNGKIVGATRRSHIAGNALL